MISFGHVVVDGFGNSHHLDTDILRNKIAVQLHDCIHRVVAADVEKRPDIVAVKHLCYAEVVAFVLVPVLQLKAAGAEYR